MKIIETNAEAIDQAVCARLELPAHTFAACWLLAGEMTPSPPTATLPMTRATHSVLQVAGASEVVTPDDGQWFIETAIALIEGADKASISGPHCETRHNTRKLVLVY